MQKIVIFAAATLAIMGCTTKPKYSNPSITDPVQSARQFTIDDGACTLAASGVRVPSVPAVSGGNYSGTITSNSGATYNYTAQSGSSFASGFAAGTNVGLAANARREKNKIYRGCMASKGWFE